MRSWTKAVGGAAVAALALTLAPPAPVAAVDPPTDNESIAQIGGVHLATLAEDMTPDGRYVAFVSDADGIVAGDAPASTVGYRFDRQTRTYARVAVAAGGGLSGPGSSGGLSMSADGRYVTFVTDNTDLGVTDANATYDVFVRDMVDGTTTLVSHGAGGAAANGRSGHPQISANGRYVSFHSQATDLGPTDTNGRPDIYRWDRTDGSIAKVTAGYPAGTEANASPEFVSFPADDGRVAFTSSATNLTTATSYGGSDGAYVRDPDASGSAGAAVPLAPNPAGGYFRADVAAFTANGRHVLLTLGGRADPADTDPASDPYVKDLQTGSLTVAYRGLFGRTTAVQAIGVDISPDGRFVLFETSGPDVVVRDTNRTADVIAVDRRSGVVRRVNRTAAGAQPTSWTDGVAITADGRAALIVNRSRGTLFTGEHSFPGWGELIAWSAVVPTRLFRTYPALDGEAFVRRQYRDLLDREPTDAELGAALADMAAGEPREVLPAELRRSSLHTGTIDPVARLYQAYFLRSPDVAGLEYWVDQRQGGRSLASISQAFASSPEFRTRYGTLTNAEFVAQIYLNILGRRAEVEGEAYWTDQLDRRLKTRGQVMIGFSESGEYRTRIGPDIDVAVVFASMLGRVPTAAERSAYAADLRQGGPLADLTGDILTGPDYVI